MTKVDKIVSEIEALPIEKRTQIIDRLLHGIAPINEEIDELWAIEAEKRISEIENGSAKTIPASDVFKEINKKHSR